MSSIILLCLAVVFASNLAVSEGNDLTISMANYENLLDRISQLEKKLMVDKGSVTVTDRVKYVEKQEMFEERRINLDRHLHQQRYYRKLMTLQSRIAHLELQELQNQEQRAVDSRVIRRLQEEVVNQQVLIEKQETTIDKFRTLLQADPDEDIGIDKEEIMPKRESESAQRTGGRIRRAIIQHPVAFTAVLDHNINHALIDQTVIFNKLLLNDGNAYSTHTGVFTVPREGMYMFYCVFASGYDPQNVWMQIVVDGSSKVAGVADTLQQAHDAQGSNLVILHLHAGEMVWVEIFQYSDVVIYGNRGFTSFSGVLLYEY